MSGGEEGGFVEVVWGELVDEVGLRGEAGARDAAERQGVEHRLVADVIAGSDWRQRAAERQSPREEFAADSDGVHGEPMAFEHRVRDRA